MADLADSQRRRAEARERRRTANGDRRGEDGAGREGGGLDLKGAAKAAAASAATGATVEAARVVVERATRGKDDEPQDEERTDGLDVKAAAKRAATAAAVGAGLAAARALASRTDSERPDQPEPPDAEDEEDVPPRDDASEPLEEAEEQPAAFDPAVEERRRASEPVRGADLGEVKRIVETAREQVEALQGRPVDSVSGVERTPTGWKVSVEVVELARIPETTDVLATYEVVLDDGGDLVRYSRGRRYNRSQADEGPES